MFCDVTEDAIINAEDISPLYAIPLNLKKQGLGDTVVKTLGLDVPPSNLEDWSAMVERMKHASRVVRVCAIGKYTGHDDAYKSINEAFTHAGIANNCRVEYKWMSAEQFEGEVAPDDILKDYDAFLIGPGFGSRGTEGKIKCIQYVRETGMPFLGICLGLQMATIEFARNVLKLDGANSTEMDPQTPYPVISLLTEQRGVTDLGGTMRLGAYGCHLKRGTKAYDAYHKDFIEERHRHRYEFNNEYRQAIEEAGLRVSGTHRLGDQELVEIVELENHPWFVGVQFHPEFKSTPLKPQPLFAELVRHALLRKEARKTASKEAAV
jgi:CTP synthase